MVLMVMVGVDQLGATSWGEEGGPRRTRPCVLGRRRRGTLDLAHSSCATCHLVLHPGACLIRLLARGRASHQPARLQEAAGRAALQIHRRLLLLFSIGYFLTLQPRYRPLMVLEVVIILAIALLLCSGAARRDHRDVRLIGGSRGMGVLESDIVQTNG